jgi:predicted porin
MAHGAFYNDEVELQNSLSFIGFEFSTGDEIELFARWEWGVNFIRGGTQFNAGSTTSGGFLSLDQVETPLFGNRLGYVGVDFGAAGRLTVGKQNAVHYDIASYTTDRWNVFGGQGSIAYPAGTDGGTLGVGRVDQAVGYRLEALRVLELGGQLQFRNADNSETLDGYGVSAQATILPGLKLGAAYTETYFSQDVKDAIPGLEGSAQYTILSGYPTTFDLGAVWATQRTGTPCTSRRSSRSPAIVRWS